MDTTFSPGGGSNAGLDGDVFAIAVQPDGRVLIGGAFTKVGRIARGRVARLDSVGGLDLSFNPGTGADDLVETLVVQADGQVLVGGRFLSLGGQPRSYLVRLNSAGAIDPGFSVSLDGYVLALGLEADGRIVLGGAFTSVNGVLRPYLARLLSDGRLDASFDPGGGPDKPVFALSLAPGGAVLVGGQFTRFAGIDQPRVARLSPHGAVDPTFQIGNGPDDLVVALGYHAEGRPLLGGSFRTVNGVARPHLARLQADGSLDRNFDPAMRLSFGGVMALRATPDGRTIAVGDFEWVGGLYRPAVVRLLANGAVDPTFVPGTGPVGVAGFPPLLRAVAIQPDGKVLLGGRMSSFDGFKANSIVRLMAEPGLVPPRILAAIGGAGGLLRVVVEAQEGRGYTLEGSANLTEWSNGPSQVATGPTVVFEVAASGVQGNFRVRVQ